MDAISAVTKFLSTRGPTNPGARRLPDFPGMLPIFYLVARRATAIFMSVFEFLAINNFRRTEHVSVCICIN